MNRLSISSLRLLQIILLFLFFQNCTKDESPGEDQNKLDRDYSGTLRFEYTRSFPAFSVIIDMDVELYKSGDILISQPSGEHYDATSEEPQTVKIRETGDIIISSLSGEYKIIDGTAYIVINANTLIDGTMTVWGWDDELGWIMPTDIPFTPEAPVKSPMNFNFSDVGFEEIIGGTVPAFQGTVTARWILGLMPLLEVQD